MLPTASTSSCSNSFTNQQHLPAALPLQDAAREKPVRVLPPNLLPTPIPSIAHPTHPPPPERDPRVGDGRRLSTGQGLAGSFITHIRGNISRVPSPGQGLAPVGREGTGAVPHARTTADANPLCLCTAKFLLQILPGTYQAPSESFQHLTHPALSLFLERSARRWSNPAFPQCLFSRYSLRSPTAAIKLRVLPSELWSGDQCDISARRQRSAPAALCRAMAQCPPRQVSYCNFSECGYSA